MPFGNELASDSSKENGSVTDIEDFASQKRPRSSPNVPITTKRRKLNSKKNAEAEFTDDELGRTWRDVLGSPPPLSAKKVIHINYELFKWL